MIDSVINSADIPLCVDLDGTIIRTDTLVESIAQLVKKNFFLVLLFPVWLARGRAHFKDRIASHIKLDVAHLPYEKVVLKLMRDARNSGRKVILCTGANERYAQAVAEHLDVFDEMIASSLELNMTRGEKEKALTQRYGPGGYDFVGNDAKDLQVMRKAHKAYLVAPTAKLLRKQRSLPDPEILVPARRPPLGVYLSQMRLHQWLKNVLIFVALLASQRFNDVNAIIAASIGFIAFGFCASSVYVLNDLMDLRADRRHPRKRNRPFASGTIPANHGLILIPLLATIAFTLASLLLPVEFLFVLVFYYFISLNYNLWAKRLAVLDTLFLAGLYTLRMIAGAAAITVVPSFWLLAFSMFFFLSVAMAKRYSELVNLELASEQRVPGRQYRKVDLDTIMSQGAASGYAAVLVLALYINSEEVLQSYSHPQVIWLTCPLLLYWINKLWLNTQRREMHDDPLVWAVENRVSRGITIMFTILLIIAI